MAVYFDYAATHPTEKEIIEKSFLFCGNPSSPHGYGIEARKALENVRRDLAKALGCTADEVFFTSGATESNNTAVFGVCKAKKRFSNRIVNLRFVELREVVFLQKVHNGRRFVFV